MKKPCEWDSLLAYILNVLIFRNILWRALKRPILIEILIKCVNFKRGAVGVV